MIKTPISVNIDGEHRLFTQPPPSSGALIPFILRVMRGYRLPENGFENFKEASLFYHRLLETFKHAFAARSMLGDENYEEVESVLKKLNNENFINTIRSKICDNQTFNRNYYEAMYLNEEDHGTTHLSVLDGVTGDAVALSSTINI